MKVLGIGDNVVDVYIPERIGFPGGNALNFSVFAKKLGHDAEFIGTFGSDFFGKNVKKILAKLKIKNDNSRTLQGENGFTKVELKNGDRKFIYSNHGGVTKTEGVFARPEYFWDKDLVHFNINGNCDQLIEYVNRENTKIIYDFSDFKINENKLQYLILRIDLACFSMPNVSRSSVSAFCKTLKKINSKISVLCTSGSKGAYFFEGKTNQLTFVEAKKIKVKDTMGAGDSFITYFSLNYFEKNQKKSIKSILEAATDFAALQCLKDGSFGYKFTIQ
ncbi:MAG: PfkB family carbohydrate kinase [Liquorilactobacillus ghanensis]|uniref:PfkB family carbohydrate kinase n=1 Tax=Liquorilactobacillus ghanensis TaxID=399370 RepID=UPI0039EB7620